MNNFAEILRVQKYAKVTYYTLAINNDEPLFVQFEKKHNKENKEKLIHIMSWIHLIGSKYGASELYFRNESEISDTQALPPPGVNRKPCYIEIDEDGKARNIANNLRLYCMRVNESVVFLFNGDVKTARRAQDCPNVRYHFRVANKLSQLINEALKEKEIRWNNDYTAIEVNDDFRLEW